MIRLLLPLLLVGALALLYVALTRRGDEPKQRAELSTTDWTVLWLLGMAAISATVALFVLVDGWWGLLPGAGWLGAVFIARRRAKRRFHSVEADQVFARQERIEELSRSGAQLLERAESAVARIQASEAAENGWLGDPGGLDFAPDLEFIADNARTSRQLHTLIVELDANPRAGEDDRKLVADARRKIDVLDAQSIERARLLQTCAEKAERIDDSLREDRENQRNELQRDEVRARMAALLYGIDSAPARSPSESTNTVVALTAAFQELKDTIDRDRQALEDTPPENAG